MGRPLITSGELAAESKTHWKSNCGREGSFEQEIPNLFLVVLWVIKLGIEQCNKMRV